MRRRLLRALVMVFLAGVFITVGLSVVLRLVFNPDRLVEEIQRQVYARTGRDAGLTQATVSLSSGVVIKNFYLLEEAPSDVETVTLSRATIGVSLWDLLRRRLRVTSLDLRGPHVELIIEPDGSTNLSDVIARLREGEPEADDQSPEVERDSPSGGPVESNDNDEDEPLRIRRIRVRGGSVTVLKRSLEQQGDRFLDLTDLSVDVDEFAVGRPFRVAVTGSLSVERQAAFAFEGEIDPARRRVAGVLTMPLLHDSLINSLLDFFAIEGWALSDGDMHDLEIRILTGDGFSPVDLDADLEFDRVETRIGFSELELDGDVDLRASYDPDRSVLELTRLKIENSRSGPDGEFNIDGWVDPVGGRVDLSLDLEGIGSDNFRGFLPATFVIEGDDTWIDVEGRLTMADGYQRGRLEGTIEARDLTVALPSMLQSDVRLDGLRVSGQLETNLASGEIHGVESLWSLPGLIEEDRPVAMVGSTATALGLDLPALDLTHLESRLEPTDRAVDATLVRVAEIALGREFDGVPIRVHLPSLGTESAEWTDISGTVRAGISGVVLEDVRARVAGGSISLSGPIGRSWRRGVVRAERVPAEHLRPLWGEPFPEGMTGVVTGELAGTTSQEEGLRNAAVRCRIESANLPAHWALEELADFTGIEEIREWRGVTADLTMALDAGGWRLADVHLAKPTVEVRFGGLRSLDERMEIAAVVSVSPAVTARLAGDALLDRAHRRRDGWTDITVEMGGTVSLPVLRTVSAAQGREIIERHAGEDIAAIFADLGVEVPDSLTIAPQVEIQETPEPPPVEPAEAPEPLIVPQPQTPPLEEVSPRPEPEPELQIPQIPAPDERESEIVE